MLRFIFLGVRGKLDSVHKGELNLDGNPASTRRSAPTNNPGGGGGLEEELARVQQMLAHNSKVYKVFVYIMHFYFFVYLYNYLYYSYLRL